MLEGRETEAPNFLQYNPFSEATSHHPHPRGPSTTRKGFPFPKRLMSAPHPSSPRSPSHHSHNITPRSLCSPALGILQLPSTSPSSPCPEAQRGQHQPLAAVSMVEASSHCCDSRCPRVNQRGYLLGTTDTRWCGWLTSPDGAVVSSTGNLKGKREEATSEPPWLPSRSRGGGGARRGLHPGGHPPTLP